MQTKFKEISMSKSVFGLVDTESQAEQIVENLKSAGFSNNDISVLFPDKGGTRDFAHEQHTKAPEGAATGAGAGGAVGGVLGWLVGIGSLAIPGVGPLIAAGPIMAALAGAGIGAAVGGLSGALIGMGIPEYEAKQYEGKIKEGNILISVHSENSEEKDRAKDIFERAGAHDISYTEEEGVPDKEASKSGFRKAEDTAGRRPADRESGNLKAVADEETSPAYADSRSGGSATIPVVEEQLNVGKKTVESGGVRVSGRVTETPVEESVRLRDERVHVERRPVDRPVREGDKFDEVVIELTETREEPVVGKQERVVEEVVVSKDVAERTETVRDTVRRKDVEVEEDRDLHKEDRR
jgi:uncharacterized protein (TIGR02271 family)